MSEPQFTPGPWSLKAGSESKIVSINGKKVATADLQECQPYDPWGQPRGRIAATPERKANAALIAAAPEMYRELENICLMCQRGEIEVEYTSRRLHGDCKNCQIGKVLKKARGEV